ncbi:unnamed protein product [Arctia plantaginis]|uniref:Uncharacterized protein n=1 Tax=Arctia plantaginis TaxID=874455 RepID=A0A8S0YQK2_ARCPL|nr:unnamed protein product [Arctia plantaginis]
MAPPPEYDKEPKAPDKSASSISTEDSKLLHNLVNEQHTNSDHKSTNTVTAVEVENKKHIETLDDGQLKALLDEAINYKNPKDREGKSDIFKELLEKAEQETDEQACEAAARTLSGCRSTRRGGRRGPPLPHSNSLQDLVAALAAEPPRKHHVRHHPPPHAPQPNVSARAIHGGSLPSGVDTSSLSEEPARGAGYLATVRCVNPPPLAERRVSASDANTPAEMELLNRRSKPMFPMTYTARATLEIGSGAVCSGRAVTTTTSSNQVRTTTTSATTPATTIACQVPDSDPQMKLMNALCPRSDTDQGGCEQIPEVKVQLNIKEKETESASTSDLKGKTNIPRGPKEPDSNVNKKEECLREFPKSDIKPVKGKPYSQKPPKSWVDNVDNWYKTLSVNYPEPLKIIYHDSNKVNKQYKINEVTVDQSSNYTQKKISDSQPAIQEIISAEDKHMTQEQCTFEIKKSASYSSKLLKIKESNNHVNNQNSEEFSLSNCRTDFEKDIIKGKMKIMMKKKKKHDLVAPTLCDINPRNIRPMSIGSPKKHLKTDPVASKEIVELPDNPVDINSNSVNICTENANAAAGSNQVSKCPPGCCKTTKKREQLKELTDMFKKLSNYASADIELKDMQSDQRHKNKNNSFSKYVALQQKLLLEIESLQDEITNHEQVHDVTTDSNMRENKTNLQVHIPTDVKQKESLELVPLTSISEETCEGVVQTCHVEENPVNNDSEISNELSNNAYVLLTLPSSNNTEYYASEITSKPKTGKKKDNLSLASSHANKKEEILNKNILKVLLFENLFKNNSNEKSVTPEVSAITNHEVDSAISFSCITTPEVVASCNTTSSTSQAAVAVDPKPRSVISSSFNGLPLSRPNYGSMGTAASDDYKVLVAYKSIDENGNSVQGFSSPLSGSSQHKKPRRKKSSKNETVIDCQQIDGYQGDKDVNELLRFIESNADNGRGAKLSRVKHKDDSDDKTGKKRSSERRKDKESKIKRASSLEELSRTKIEDLTDATEGSLRGEKKDRREHAPAKQERRSWGDDAREPLEPAPSELTDFQTVTKKRKPRRRADESERDPPRRARPPSPRARRESAPPSDRSNDSNDDLDSVHSLPDAPRPPPAPALPAPHASYAEIARTRHNIPDLIESCNFYAEGEGAPRPETAPPGDADGYPALDARAAAARRRDLKAAAVSLRRDRKERAAPAAEGARAPDCPAPDVVADRRPPVILLDSAVRPRDMDGVTFGFDINEQLLSGPARRPRCDLLRDALAAAVPVRAAAALRYVPPDAPHDTHHLCQIVDYVGAAWEDVLRCGNGKVRYFNE